MARAAPKQTNFRFGEISPKMFGRVDEDLYFGAVKSLENTIVLPQAVATRRPGTHFIIEARDSSKFVRLIPFERSAALSYVLEFGDEDLRFHFDHGTLVEARDFINGAFDADIADWTDISSGTGSIAWNAGVLDLVGVGAGNEARAEQSFPAVSINQYTVTVDVTGNTVTYKVGSTTGATDIATGTVVVGVDQTFTFTSTTSQEVFITFENAASDTRSIDNVRLSGPVYVIDTPYLATDLDLIKFAQSGDDLYIAHPSFAPRRLTRVDVNEWTLTVLDFVDGPYLDTNTETTTMTPSATTGSVTVTASSIVGINDDQGFLSTDSGRIIRIDNPASNIDWGWGVITAYLTALTVTVEVREPFATANADVNWRLGAWSGTTGWPEAVTFFEQRLVFANSDTEQDRFWMSKTAEQEVFSPTAFDGTVSDDNAVTYQIADDRINAIHWLDGGDVLSIGTATGEYVVNASTSNQAVTPTNISVRRQTTHGSEELVRPIRIDHRLFHLQRAGRKLQNFFFDFDINAYRSEDVTHNAEHITRSGIFDVAYQQEPATTLWAVRGDGVLLGLALNSERGVEAWQRHFIGGLFNGANAAVESIAAIPSPDGGSDELWLSVLRTVDGATQRYVEYMDQPFDNNVTNQVDAFFVDSGLEYNGAPATSFGGLDHLEGETLSVLADGAVHPDVVVTSGVITLVREASVVQAGLRQISKLELLPPEGGGILGPSSGKIRRISSVLVQFFETLGAFVGDPDTLEELVFRSGGDLMDDPPPIQSGYKKVNIDQGYEREPTVIIQQEQPLPMSIIGVTVNLDTGES